jgi:hypothetical protein
MLLVIIASTGLRWTGSTTGCCFSVESDCAVGDDLNQSVERFALISLFNSTNGQVSVCIVTMLQLTSRLREVKNRSYIVIDLKLDAFVPTVLVSSKRFQVVN